MTTEERTVAPDRILAEATRIAELLVDVQTRVNARIDGALAELHSGDATARERAGSAIEHFFLRKER